MSERRREVYPNAPVALVALEVRHPYAESLTMEQRRSARDALADHSPIMRSGRAQQLELVGQLGGPTAQNVRSEEYPRFMDRDSTVAVSMRTDAVVVETTRYGSWERLRAVAAAAFVAREQLGGVAGVDRVGLRYVDEIRVPDTSEGWKSWVDASLLGPSAAGAESGLTATESQGAVVFQRNPDSRVVLRYGSLNGFAVDPNGELRRPTMQPGPFFLLDIDCFWTATTSVPEFDTEWLMATADDLHEPVRALFESLITERLRVEVLRVGN